MVLLVYPGSGFFLPIPDPGIKKESADFYTPGSSRIFVYRSLNVSVFYVLHGIFTNFSLVSTAQ